MKRIIITCLMAVGIWLTAVAGNTVTLTSTQGHPGDEVEVAVMLTNETAVTAMEVLIPLGSALSYVDDSAVLNAERADGHVLSAAEQDGKLSIVIFSTTLAPLKHAEGEVCRFKVKLGKEPASYTLMPEIVMSDAGGNAIQCEVVSGVVTLLSPKIEVLTPTIDYARVPIRSSYTQTFTLRNSGNEPLEITGFSFDNADLSASPASCTVEAGETKSVTLTYAPWQRGTVTSNVTIASNAINPKAGKATVKAQPFSVDELHVQGAQGVSDEEVTVVLKMNNMEPITGAQCEFALPEALKYVEGSAAVGSRCAGTDHKVSGVVQNGVLTLFMYSPTNKALPEGDGELMTFRVRLDGQSGWYELNPREVVLSNATMENMTSATSGNYVEIKSPSFSSSETLVFGDTPITEKATATYSISNNGSVNLVISKVTFLAEGYAVESELPLTIAPWESGELKVSYIPTKEGEHKTTMQIYTNDPLNRMYSVAVSGSIYEPNSLTVSGDNTQDGYRFAFSLDNYTDIVAVQMNVKWLPGMKTSMEQMMATDRLKGHSYLVTEIGDGQYQVLIYSMSNTPIAGNSGELFTLDYTASEGAQYRDTELEVIDIVLSDAKGSNYVSGSDVKAIATFKNFTLRFVVEGETVSEQFIKAGTAVVAPEVAERVGHSFVWTGLPQTMPGNDVTVTGNYTTNSYTVTYMVDGEVYKTESYAYGAAITAAEAPTKEGHTFSGWSEVPETMPSENITITGSFTVNSYTITYKIDGEVYKTESIAYGSKVEAIASPTKEGYTFSGWSGVPATMPAKDVTVNGSFTVNSYTVTYMVDGEVYKTESIAYGSKVEAIVAPTKEGWTFSGWNGVPATMPAKDITVSGSFTVNSYTVTYMVDGEVYKTDSVAYGASITAAEAPTKEGHTFSGWSEVPETMPSENITITGSFTVNSYTVTFILEGELFAEYTLLYGSVIEVPEAPEKEGLTFSGWGKVPETMPAQNLVYEGSYMNNSYTIIYIVDGVEYHHALVEYGSAIALIATPTKEGHTFSGWSEMPETMPAKDVTVTGHFTINKYLVTFKVDDEVIAADSLEYGATIVAPEAPDREGYTFDGWGEVAETVPAGDLTYEGSYSVNTYLLTYTVDGETVQADSVVYGTAITALAEPTKEGHTFSGWSEVPATMPAKDVTISGVFSINTYLVTFKIGDEVIAADSLAYGAAIVAPEAPEKEGHTFNGWGEVAETVPAGDLTYEGSYSVNTYLLTYTVDGETVQADSVVYGTAITALADPTKEGHTFSGWSEIPATMPAKDVTISGVFSINTYLVTFKIGDEVIAADSLTYGAAIVAPEAPEKEGHTFNGWGEVAETVPAGDVTYEGSYSVNTYLLTYTVDGETVLADSVVYGTAITALADPTKEGHTFSGWSEIPATMPAKDVTISGVFFINTYLVTFKIGNEVIAADSLTYGAAIVAPEAPEKEGYTFNGWGEVAETVPAGDVTYEGGYTANIYKVYYYVGEELVHTAEVIYGEAIPEYIYEPTEEGYTFLGWLGEVYETMPAHDVTYTANIESGINQLPIDNGQLTIYDLMGRKVTDTENLKGGIYIINGKKTVIK